MDFSRFYGLSAVQMMIANREADDSFKTYVSLLNNPNDYQILISLKEEFNILKGFLDNNVTYGYTDKQDQRNYRKYIKIVNGLKEEIGNKSVSKYSLTAFKELEELNDERLSNGISEVRNEVNEILTSLSGKKREVKGMMTRGQMENLTSEEIEIVKRLARARNKIDSYVKVITDVSVSDITVFDKKLYFYSEEAGDRFLYQVNNFMKKSRTRTSISECSSQLSVLEGFMNDSGVEESSDNGLVVDDETGYLVLGPILEGSLNEEELVIGNQLIRRLEDMGLVSRLRSERDTKSLVDIYIGIRTMYNVDYYNEKFDIELTEKEYEEVFDKFAEFGLVGLNLVTEEMFFDSLNTISFDVEKKTHISKESGLGNAIRLVRRMLTAYSSLGSIVPNSVYVSS